jgi:hypothetical protein
VSALHMLAEAGLTVRADGHRLIVMPASRLTAPLRDLIRSHKAELLACAERSALVVKTERSGNPLMTAEQADRCHSPCWSDGEIGAFATCVLVFIRRGIQPTDADDLAERLVLRDRDQDDRHSCAECRHGRSPRCPDGSPLPAGVLHRCGGYAP